MTLTQIDKDVFNYKLNEYAKDNLGKKYCIGSYDMINYTLETDVKALMYYDMDKIKSLGFDIIGIEAYRSKLTLILRVIGA